jgi:hypothetical protein
MPLLPPFYMIAYDDGDSYGDAGGLPGGAPQPPPEGSVWGLTGRWVDVRWTFREPEPGGACTGFEVAIFAGAGVEDGALAAPVALLDDPASSALPGVSGAKGHHRHVALVELGRSVELKAAVRACYGRFRSAWAEAAAPAAFLPDALPYGGEAGSIKLPDGTVMQWLTSAPLYAEGAYTLAWPAPFQTACHCAAVTAVADEANNIAGNDNWLQIISRDAAGIRLSKQSPNEALGRPIRAHVVAWGR